MDDFAFRGSTIASNELDPVDLDHDTEDGDIEGEEEEAIDEHDQGGYKVSAECTKKTKRRPTEVAELPQTPYSTRRPDAKRRDLNSIVPDNANSNLPDRIHDDLLRCDRCCPSDTLAFSKFLQPLQRR